MNRFIVMNGLPYLYDKGKAYCVRWDDEGFTVGSEVEITSEPAEIFSDLSVKAQCAENLDSIKAEKPKRASRKKAVKEQG